MTSLKNDCNDCDSIETSYQTNKGKKIVSKEWLVIDKRENFNANSGCAACCSNSPVHVGRERWPPERLLLKLRPFIPLTVEEASMTTDLTSWSNCNVRLTGALRYNADKIDYSYYLESVNENFGPYRIALDFSSSSCSIPLLNEVVQIFGCIKLFSSDRYTPPINPFIKVNFFRNMESGNYAQYMEAIEKMKKFVPLYIKTTTPQPVHLRNYEESYDSDNIT